MTTFLPDFPKQSQFPLICPLDAINILVLVILGTLYFWFIVSIIKAHCNFWCISRSLKLKRGPRSLSIFEAASKLYLKERKKKKANARLQKLWYNFWHLPMSYFNHHPRRQCNIIVLFTRN